MKKELRLKKSHEIASIVNARKKVVNKNFIIYYRKNNTKENRFAFSVSKKYGHAFERNKAKRISRNVFRKLTNVCSGVDFVIVIKKEFKKANYLELEKEGKFLIELVDKRVKENKNDIKKI